MKPLSLTIFILSMGFLVACQDSAEVPARKSPGQNAGTTQSVPNQTTTTATTPALNPPHGQPYHRCDIPVGAPLNSSLGKQPAATTSETTTTETAPGMNPPHGQPNHRCDIPVGAPLNSSPGNPK